MSRGWIAAVMVVSASCNPFDGSCAPESLIGALSGAATAIDCGGSTSCATAAAADHTPFVVTTLEEHSFDIGPTVMFTDQIEEVVGVNELGRWQIYLYVASGSSSTDHYGSSSGTSYRTTIYSCDSIQEIADCARAPCLACDGQAWFNDCGALSTTPH